MIEVSELTVTFAKGASEVHAVRRISFHVEVGEAFGIVGESGSGKSTVLRALCGLNNHWSGAVVIGNRVQGPRREKAFFKTVQMVFQDPWGSLHPRQTVNRTLLEPLAIHGIGDVDRKIEEALLSVGLEPGFRYRYPHQLSGGQRQRVAIARALILEPKVVLLDEPTSALDVSVQAEILNLLVKLRRARGLTYILVSHNLAVVAHMCERIAVMNQGRIVEEITVDQLRSGELSHPYTEQLLRASSGYDRATAESLVTYD